MVRAKDASTEGAESKESVATSRRTSRVRARQTSALLAAKSTARRFRSLQQPAQRPQSSQEDIGSCCFLEFRGVQRPSIRVMASMALGEGIEITSFDVDDVRFPTSLTGDGTDAMNQDCDYSMAYVRLHTNNAQLTGYGMTFTIGRGNDIVCDAIKQVAARLLKTSLADHIANMGAAWDHLLADPQLRWIGPEKGVIHLATGAVVNALWDLYARLVQKPLWRVIADFTPEEFVRCVSFRYLSDAITKDEALTLLRQSEPHKRRRIEDLEQQGYPAYTTSAGWSGYSDEKVATLLKEAIRDGLNHFKIKVGQSIDIDRRRLAMVRRIIDDPALVASRAPPDPASLEGKNAGPSGNVLMIDANQVWDVEEAVAHVSKLAEYRPWFIEEPTAPDDILGHAKIRQALKPLGIGVATGEHAHNRMIFKQLLQAQAIDVLQLDSCRVAGVNECLAIMLLAAKFGVPVCPHAGGVGLCEMVIHLSAIDYICVSGQIERNVLEWVDHLHEHFVHPCSLNQRGRYNLPVHLDEGYSVQLKDGSLADFRYPGGDYWTQNPKQ